MRVWLDRQRMAANGIAVNDIATALRANNVELPAGRLESDSRSFTVRADNRLATVEEFRDLVLRQQGSYQLRVGDVARVELGVENDDTELRANGETAVGLGIIRQSKPNTVSSSDNVRAENERNRENRPWPLSTADAADE